MSKKIRFYNYKSEDEFEEHLMKKTIMRNILCISILIIVAIILSFLRVQPPFLPKMFAVEFSVFPELIASIAYGPLIGVVVCLVKNIVHIAVMNNYLIIDASNFVVESVFVVVVGIYYISKMFPIKKNAPEANEPLVYDPFAYDSTMKFDRFFRGKTIIKGSLLGAVFALPVKFLTTNYFVYPMLEKQYSQYNVTEQKIISNYNVSIDAICGYLPQKIAALIPHVKTAWQGILMVNLPVTFVKLVFVVLLTLLIYPFISPLMHNIYE